MSLDKLSRLVDQQRKTQDEINNEGKRRLSTVWSRIQDPVT